MSDFTHYPPELLAIIGETPAPPVPAVEGPDAVLSIFDRVHLPGRQRVARVLPIANPAAGGEFSVTVPPGVVWILQSLRMVLTTSAVVASRRPQMTITTSDGVIFEQGAGVNLTASQAWGLTWCRPTLGPQTSTGAQNVSGFPEIPLLATWTLSTITVAIDPGDQYSAIVLYVIELRPPDARV